MAAAAVEVASQNYDIEAPDAETAKAKQAELEWSAALFADLFSLAPPRGRVTFSQGAPGAPGGGMHPPAMGGSAGGAKWTLPWFTGALPGVPAGMASQMKALTHEAAHLQLVHLVNDGCASELKSSFNGYGSYLPDWVDECVAVYHEPDGQKKERRTQLKAAIGKHIPLDEYFTMDHPIGGKGAAGLPPGMQPPPGGGVGGGAMPMGPGMEKANTYYVQSLSVIEYLTDVGGKPFFRFCVARLQQGAGMDAVLAEWSARYKDVQKLMKTARRRPWSDADAQKVGGVSKPGPATTARNPDPASLWPLLRPRKGEKVGKLPPSVEGLEVHWLEWVKKKYPGYRPKLPRYPG
jgi:hypothetical protein